MLYLMPVMVNTKTPSAITPFAELSNWMLIWSLTTPVNPPQEGDEDVYTTKVGLVEGVRSAVGASTL